MQNKFRQSSSFPIKNMLVGDERPTKLSKSQHVRLAQLRQTHSPSEVRISQGKPIRESYFPILARPIWTKNSQISTHRYDRIDVLSYKYYAKAVHSSIQIGRTVCDFCYYYSLPS